MQIFVSCGQLWKISLLSLLSYTCHVTPHWKHVASGWKQDERFFARGEPHPDATCFQCGVNTVIYDSKLAKESVVN
jgi:hypothetical protein